MVIEKSVEKSHAYVDRLLGKKAVPNPSHQSKIQTRESKGEEATNCIYEPLVRVKTSSFPGCRSRHAFLHDRNAYSILRIEEPPRIALDSGSARASHGAPLPFGC